MCDVNMHVWRLSTLAWGDYMLRAAHKTPSSSFCVMLAGEGVHMCGNITYVLHVYDANATNTECLMVKYGLLHTYQVLINTILTKC